MAWLRSDLTRSTARGAPASSPRTMPLPLARVEPAGRPPDLQQDLLHDLLGLRRVAQHLPARRRAPSPRPGRRRPRRRARRRPATAVSRLVKPQARTGGPARGERSGRLACWLPRICPQSCSHFSIRCRSRIGLRMPAPNRTRALVRISSVTLYQPSCRPRGVLAGLLSGAIGVCVGFLVAGLTGPVGSPVVAVGRALDRPQPAAGQELRHQGVRHPRQARAADRRAHRACHVRRRDRRASAQRKLRTG